MNSPSSPTDIFFNSPSSDEPVHPVSEPQIDLLSYMAQIILW